MIKEVFVGKRLVQASCSEKRCSLIFSHFLKILNDFNKELAELMDAYEIPQQISINFQRGNMTLDGMYLLSKKDVSKHIVGINIYVEKWLDLEGKNLTEYKIRKDLLDTLAHEIIHHKIQNEEKTIKKTKEFIKKIKFK